MTTKSELITILQSRGIHLKRRLGQNFLIDPNFLQFIIRTANLSRDDYVLEIGSGLGILTRLIAEKGRYVWAVEVDEKLYEVSQDLFSPLTNVTWLNTSILDKDNERLNQSVIEEIKRNLSSFTHPKEVKSPPPPLLKGDKRGIKAISNLPYSSSGAIIMALMESNLPIELMVLMVQSEMADRLAAKPGTKEYNAFTILVNLLGEVKIVRRIPPTLFFPEPEVNSAVITIIPRHTKPQSYQILKGFLQSVFRYRRKTIGHILSQGFKRAVEETNPEARAEIYQILTNCGISPTMRPEEITLEDYLKLVYELTDS